MGCIHRFPKRAHPKFSKDVGCLIFSPVASNMKELTGNDDLDGAYCGLTDHESWFYSAKGECRTLKSGWQAGVVRAYCEG